MDGSEHSVTSYGQGVYNTVGASAGIASFLGLGANGGCNGGILGGLFGGNNGGSCHVDQRELAYATELAACKGREYALAIARDEDDRRAETVKQLTDGLLAVGNGVSRLDAKVACLEKDVAFLQRESERNLREAKEYTDNAVAHEAQLRKAADDNLASWTQSELNKKIDGTLKMNGDEIAWNRCKPVLEQCGCGSYQNPYFIGATDSMVTAITESVIAAIKKAQ